VYDYTSIVLYYYTYIARHINKSIMLYKDKYIMCRPVALKADVAALKSAIAQLLDKTEY
jgi:hypothetical protein